MIGASSQPAALSNAHGHTSFLQTATTLFQAPTKTRVKYFMMLDLARGIAALFVVLYHYTHFYVSTGGVNAQSPDEWPLFGLFWLPYQYGYWAVQFFWLISGFIFANVYIGTRCSSWQFFANRLARLYPLHIITLFVVAALQWMRISWLNDFAIYQNNDLYHFILQLAFASDWGLERGFSFNGPIWSVSLEILIYIVFWISLRFLYARGILWPVMLCLCFVLLSAANLPGKRLWTCGFYFFSGTCVYLAFQQLRAMPKLLIAAGIAMVSAAVFAMYILPMVSALPKVYCLLIGLLLLVCWADSQDLGIYLQRLRFIGDSTYSIYLWHVPIQLVILLYLDGIAMSRAIVASDLFLSCYVLTVIMIGHLSYRYIERPLRNKLRVWMLADAVAAGPNANRHAIAFVNEAGRS